MKLPMHGAQVLAVHVGVELGGGEVGVAQHLLDRPQVSSALEQVRGEAVAQRMRRDTLGEPSLLCGAPDDRPRSDARQRRAAGIEKQDPPALPLVEAGADLTRVQRDRTERSEEHTSELQSLAYLVCRL